MSYWSRSFPGHAACLSEVRQFTAAVIGDRPGADAVVLAVSELAANAILHTASGEPGGQFVVHLATYADRWQVRVDDGGGPKVPKLCVLDECDAAASTPGAPTQDSLFPDFLFQEAEAGRGLALVAAVSRTWGILGDHYSRAVWAEIPHPRDADVSGSLVGDVSGSRGGEVSR